jgi:SAM-dependent methyltransferase
MPSHLAPSVDHLLAQARDATASGQYRQAFDALYAAIALAPESARARAALGQFLVAHCPARRHADVDRVLCLALDQAWVRPSELAPAVLAYLAGEPAVAQALIPSTHATSREPPSARQVLTAAGHLDGQPVFCAVARVAILADADWQTLLARLRDLLLMRRHEGKRDTPLRLTLALALQNDLTEGIEPPSRDMLARAQALEAALLARLQTGTAVNAADIALVATAMPLADSPLVVLLRSSQAQREWPGLGPLIERVQAASRELAVRGRLRVEATPTAGDPVRDHYEAHPYPRWVREPLGMPAHLPAPVARRIAAWPPTGAQVLVAGCGTGQQIFVAHDRYPLARITAIDFSVNALAHGVHKCAEAGLDDVDFHAMDLHQVAQLGQTFRAIECVGVLPHLADPEAGVAALASVMASDAVMHVAVYSARARAPFEALRRRIRAEGWTDDADGRLAFRRTLIREGGASLPDVVARSPDFHAAGGLRDLLFHVRECALPMTEWVAMARRQGLKLLAVDAPAATAAMARCVVDQDPATLTPDQWDEVEQAYPAAFAGLYRLWLAKA